MPASKRERAKEIFADALAMPRAERGAFLESACGGDPRLRAIVDGLLAAHHSASVFLAEPTLHADAHAGGRPAGPEEAQEEAAGAMIDRYRLLRPIGEGGFGTVHLAEQTRPVVRRVALKIIRRGMDTKRVVARFEAERQALALMDHPSIARVLDAGATSSGRPYFVMEYVQGDPITDYCVRKGLCLEERLRLFERVCMAVQHAHQKGVIHRDIKPSNVLVTQVDGEPAPKVIDFGVAKAIEGRLSDQTIVTEERSLLGTPAYMSPEQASMSPGAVDTRSDVYSLGVLLYEMLTETPPFEHDRLREASFGEFQRIMAEEQPRRPSTRLGERTTGASEHERARQARLRRQIRGDLDWIVLRALEKDRSRRYQSAGALAADIRRFLVSEPVEAGPPSRVYRAVKFMRRHRAGVAAASLAFVALVAGLALALAGLAEARSQRNAAVAALEESRYLTQFLTNTISSVEPLERGRDTTVAEMLDDAADELDAGFEGRPTVLATMRHTLGNSYMALGLYAKAETQFRQALRLREDALGGNHPETIRILANVAAVLYEQDRVPDALRASEQAMARYEAAGLGDSREALGLLGNRAAMLNEVGRVAETVELRRRLLERAETALPADDEIRLAAKLNLAIVLREAGEVEEAAALLEENLEAWRAAQGEGSPGALMAAEALARSHAAMGRPEQAAATLEELLARKIDTLGVEHADVQRTRVHLAALLQALGRDGEAEELLVEAVRVGAATIGPAHRVTLGALSALTALYDARAWSGVAPERAALVGETLAGAAADPDLSMAMANTVAYLLVTIEPPTLRRPDLALPLAEEAVHDARERAPHQLVYCLDTLGLAQLEAGMAEAALATLEETLELADALSEAERAEVRGHRDRAASALRSP